jgi:hypothetical protein
MSEIEAIKDWYLTVVAWQILIGAVVFLSMLLTILVMAAGGKISKWSQNRAMKKYEKHVQRLQD